MFKIDSEKTKYLFIDYFDTIVHRSVNEQTVKMIAADIFAQKYASYSPRHYFEARLDAEKHLKFSKSFKHEASYQRVIHEMYARLPKLWEIISEGEFYKKHLLSDISAEKSVQYIDEDSVNILKSFKSNDNKGIYIVSDFYLPKEAFQEFLNYHGLKDYVNGIYVSSDIDKRKSDGSMYEYLKRIYNPENVIMYGNNEVSVVSIAKSKGFNAVLKKYEIKNYPYPNKKYINSQLKKIYLAKKKAVPFGGYSFYYYMFIDKLYNKLCASETKTVLFMAREGQFLKKIFDKYVEIKNDHTIETHYLYVSRVSTVAASLNDITKEKFESVFERYPDISIADFLKTIGLNAADRESIVNACSNPNKQIENFENSIEFSKLKKNTLFLRAYEKNRTNQKKLLCEYINSIVGSGDQPLHIVDVGWKGTIQDSIFKAFDGKRKVNGYYVGQTDVGLLDRLNLKNGLLFSEYPDTTKYYSYFSQNTLLVEQIASANHGSTKGYRVDNGTVKPLLGNLSKADEKVYDLVKSTQEEILNSFEEYDQLFRDSVYCPQDFMHELAYEYLQNLLLLTSQEKKVMREIRNNTEFNFGVMGDKGGNSLRVKISNMLKMSKKILKELLLRKKVAPLYGYYATKTITEKLNLTRIIEPILFKLLFMVEKKYFIGSDEG